MPVTGTSLAGTICTRAPERVARGFCPECRHPLTRLGMKLVCMNPVVDCDYEAHRFKANLPSQWVHETYAKPSERDDREAKLRRVVVENPGLNIAQLARETGQSHDWTRAALQRFRARGEADYTKGRHGSYLWKWTGAA